MARKKKSDAFGFWPKPDFTEIVKTNKDYSLKFQNALSYVHYELTPADLKKEVVKYLTKLDPKHPLLTRVKDANENRMLVGKYMWIVNNGGQLPDDILKTLLPTLERVLDEEEAQASKKEEKAAGNCSKTPQKNSVESISKLNIQDRLEIKAHEVAGEVEGWLDAFCNNKKTEVKAVEDFVNLFKIQQLKSVHMRHLQNIFQNRVDEIEEAVEGKNKDLVEGYSNFTKPELKKLDQFYKNLMKATTMLQEVAKVERAPRKKKPISLDKVVARLKYKKEDSALGIVSLNPVNILGSKEVWLYNTKTRKISQYKASSEQGLGVKGASLTNFSTESVEKTLRKPAEQLADFKKATKVKLRTFLKDLSTVDVPCGGKINEHCVILRIDK
jgi:hypothetical protein